MSNIAPFIPHAPYVYLAKEDTTYHIFVLIGVQEGMQLNDDPEIIVANQQVSCKFQISQADAPEASGLTMAHKYVSLEVDEDMPMGENSELVVVAELSGQESSIKAHKIKFKDCDELTAAQMDKTVHNEMIINSPYVYLSSTLEYGKELFVPRVMMYLKGILEEQTAGFNSLDRVTKFDFKIKIVKSLDEIPVQLINPSLFHCNQLQSFYAIETPVTFRFEVDPDFKLTSFRGSNHIGKRRNVCSSSGPEAVYHY